MRRLLDAYRVRKTADSLDEWNPNEPQMMRAMDPQQAAFLASARIYLEDAPTPTRMPAIAPTVRLRTRSAKRSRYGLAWRRRRPD